MVELSYKNIINLTPHPIIILDEKGHKIVTFPTSDIIARVESDRRHVANLNVRGVKVPITKIKSGDVYDMPEPQEDTIYIVSTMTARGLPDRQDLYIADGIVKDEYSGRTIGCRSLRKVNDNLSTCPNCGGSNPEGARFCCHCGSI